MSVLKDMALTEGKHVSIKGNGIVVQMLNPDPLAANILAFTKQTRLTLDGGLFEEVKAWPKEKLEEELEYISNSIRSSWEFIDVTFSIQNFSRAAQQQLTRTRTANYAMQSLRILDMSDFDMQVPPSIRNNPRALAIFEEVHEFIGEKYRELVSPEVGAQAQDARGVLPLNTCSGGLMKINLRNLIGLITARTSARTQGEYTEIVDGFISELRKHFWWIEPFLEDKKMAASKKIYKLTQELQNDAKIDEATKQFIWKQIDHLKGVQ